MKSNIPFLAMITAIVFASSCSRKTPATLLPELQQAEAVMYAYPDSALRILEQMPMPADRLNHATWCLFLAQAKYKNYIQQPTDSLVCIAGDYFMEQDDPQRKALTLYMKGAISRELTDSEEALQLYLEAADEVRKSTDYQLGHLIYTEIGQIYSFSRLHDYAEEALKKSYDYAVLSGNSKYVMSSSMLLGRLYVNQQDWEHALIHYEDAMSVADSIGYDRASGRIMLEMSYIYGIQGDYPKALKYAQKEFRLKDENDPDYHQSLFTLGSIYSSMNKVDSACYYFNKTLSSNDLNTLKSAYGSLVLLYYNTKKFEEAFKYVEQYYLCSDSIQKIDRANAIVEIQEKYNKEKLLNEKNQLTIERSRTLRTTLLIFIILLCAIVVIIYRYQRRLLQKERTIQKNEEQLRLYTLKIHEKESLINRNENRIQELSIEMEQNKEMQELLEEQRNVIIEIQKQNETLRNEKEELREGIYHNSSASQEKSKELDMLDVLAAENLRLQNRELFLSNQLLKKTQVLNDLKVSPRPLNSAGWDEVIEAIDWLYENYASRLMKSLPILTARDLQVCCLIKLHFTIPEMATILAISPTSVSKYKFRLKERIIEGLGKPLGENKSLDIWLWEY